MGVLCTLARRGVRVSVLTNSLASTDVPIVHAGYARYRPRLLACDVALHELRPGATRFGGARVGLSSGARLHTKAVVVDRKFVLVGSMNLDPRSRLSNSEISVLIESAVLGGQLGTLFEEGTAPDQAFRVELTSLADEHAPLVWIGRENNELTRYTSEPLAGWWRRFASGLLGALAPKNCFDCFESQGHGGQDDRPRENDSIDLQALQDDLRRASIEPYAWVHQRQPRRGATTRSSTREPRACAAPGDHPRHD